MTEPFPHEYRARISRTLASRPRVDALPRQPSSALDDDTSSSPEHLVLSALGISLLATCEAFAARDGIAILDWAATVHGSVEPTPDGLMFTSIVLCIDIEIAGKVELVANMLEDAKQQCLVLNSLRVPVVIETVIRTVNGIQIELPSATLDAERQALAS